MSFEPTTTPTDCTLDALVAALLQAELMQLPEPLLTPELQAVVVEIVTRTLLRLEWDWVRCSTVSAGTLPKTISGNATS